MSPLLTIITPSIKTIGLLLLATLATLSSHSLAGVKATLIDDFSHDVNNSLGFPRQFMDDKVVGGNTQTQLEMKNGIMHLKGDIEPPRGQPGWASTVLLLDAQGKAIDVSQYEGVRMRVKIHTGSLSVSANSTDITNFDYHTAVVMASADGKFHEINLPFDSMKRTWSEQTQLNTKTINSLSIVAFSLNKAPFDYAIDDVSFY